MILNLRKSFRNWWPLFFLYFLHWNYLWQMESRVFCVNAFLALVPSKGSEKSFHWIVQKTAIPTDNCQLVVQLAPVAYMRRNMKCLNTNTSEPLKHCVCAVGRPVFSCNSNHRVMFSSKKNGQNQILPLLQGNWRMQNRITWPACVVAVDLTDVRYPHEQWRCQEP